MSSILGDYNWKQIWLEVDHSQKYTIVKSEGSEQLDVPYFPDQLLGWDFYSMIALDSNVNELEILLMKPL